MAPKYKIHPFAELFPMMAEHELAELASDIKANGQRDEVMLYDNTVIDGRNRIEACSMVKIEPKYKIIKFKDGTEALNYVLSKNLNRRHLSESQRAMIGARLANMRQGERTDLEPSANLPKVSNADAAERLKVSERNVRNAKQMIANAPQEIVEAVDSGTLSVSAAATVSELPKEEQQELIAKGVDAVKQKASEMRRPKAQPATAPEPEPVSEREPEADGDPEQTDTTDENGPTDAVDDYNKEVNQLCRDMDEVARRIESLKEKPLSRFTMWQGAKDQVRSARNTLWQGRPVCDCPYCKEINGEAQPSCKACHGHGVVTKITYESKGGNRR